MYYKLLLFFVLLGVLSCNNDKTDSPTPVDADPTVTTEIKINISNPSPLNVDINANKPSIEGEIKSNLPLKKYNVSLFDNGIETQIIEEALSEVLQYNFKVTIPYKLTSDSVVITASNNKDESNSASVILNIESNPVQTTNKDAFPGAEGHGRYTTGGRGGKVLFVDNLNDNYNEGSLRWAINQSGARIIVFRVSGTIQLSAPLEIKNGNLTIAGHSAPGDGICVSKNYLRLADNVDNVIIRYLRFRNANGSGEYDAAWGRNGSNIIIDHCSFSWGNDEVASFYDNKNFTMQWCMITESFYHSTHPKGDHGYGGIWGGMNASFHHNLIAHHTSRNPRFCGARYHEETRDLEIVDFRNNVLYNWGFNSVYGGEYGKHNMVNNYYKAGPATGSSKKNRIVEITEEDSKWYIAGNYVDGYPAISLDNWSGGVQGKSSSASIKAAEEFPKGEIITQTAEEAYNDVIAKVGASKVRDAVDARIINEVKSGTATYTGTYGPGIIDSEIELGGFPSLSTYEEITDADNDGMDDAWEQTNGLNPQDKNDNALFSLNSNYMNIEVYLNSLLN